MQQPNSEEVAVVGQQLIGLGAATLSAAEVAETAKETDEGRQH